MRKDDAGHFASIQAVGTAVKGTD